MRKLKKVMLPLLLSMILLVGSCLPVMAAFRTVETADGMELAFEEEYDQEKYPYWIAYKNGSQYIIRCTSAKLFYDSGIIKAYGALQQLYCNNTFIDNRIHVYSYTSGYYSDTSYKNLKDATSGIVAANYDVCDASGNVVFQKPPEPIVKEPTRLQMVTEGIQMTAVMKEIIGMIPLLIPLLAGFLGLRKALSLISRTLQAA